MSDINLLERLKRRLKIDWDDDDDELKEILNSSLFYFENLLDAKNVIDLDSSIVEFILERSRYAWNNAVDEFEKNFSSELNALIQRVALNEWRKNHEKDKRDF